MKITLCLIVWNELKGCMIDVPNIPNNIFDEIIAIDGGSTDGTVDYLREVGIQVLHQENKGLNAAYIQANRVAKNDAIVVFFPKGTIPTSDLTKFVKFFLDGYELIIASRQVENSFNEEDLNFFKPRKWGVRLLAYFISILWRVEGNYILDVLHGVKGWRREAFDKMKITDTGLSIDLEMVVRSYKLQIPRKEFPTIESPRFYGETRFKIFPTSIKLSKYLLFELRRND
jgi:glycosyltransferase involved in cell wall biosynthesis